MLKARQRRRRPEQRRRLPRAWRATRSRGACAAGPAGKRLRHRPGRAVASHTRVRGATARPTPLPEADAQTGGPDGLATAGTSASRCVWTPPLRGEKGGRWLSAASGDVGMEGGRAPARPNGQRLLCVLTFGDFRVCLCNHHRHREGNADTETPRLRPGGAQGLPAL